MKVEIVDAAWAVARDEGLGSFTLSDVARRVSMRAPSLYSYFASKNDIYDAMFFDAWSGCLAVTREVERTLPDDPRAGLMTIARTFFDYAVADLPRHQLMNQRTIPGFEPSAEAYRPAVEVLEVARTHLLRFGVTDDGDFDLWVALLGGLVNAQQSNDPGGDRWFRLLDRSVEMFADHVGIPPAETTRP